MKTILQIGGKYNSWTICAFDGVDEKRRRRYLCQCDCGIKKSLAASAVASILQKLILFPKNCSI